MTDGTDGAVSGMSVVSRILGVVMSPGRTMADVVARPTWLVPVLLVALVAAASTFALYDSVILPMQMERFEKNPDIPAEQLQKIEDQMASPIARVAGCVAPALIVPVIILIQAGLIALMGSLILGGQSTFRTVFAVCAWASVVYIIGVLVQSPIYAKATHRMESVASLAFLLPSDAPSAGVRFLRGMLGAIDVFQLWQTAVQAIGISLAYRRPRSFGWTCAGVAWFLGALLSGMASVIAGRAR